jgi:hypothetical protein
MVTTAYSSTTSFEMEEHNVKLSLPREPQKPSITKTWQNIQTKVRQSHAS